MSASERKAWTAASNRRETERERQRESTSVQSHYSNVKSTLRRELL